MNKPSITSDTACLVRELVNKACPIRQSEGTASPGGEFADIACPVRQSWDTDYPGREFNFCVCPKTLIARISLLIEQTKQNFCPKRLSIS